MKSKSLTSIILNLLVAGFAVVNSKPAPAYTNKYFCAVLNGTPRTFVRTERGNRAIISWVNQVGRWNPLERCIAVSNRFQRFHDHGILRYVGTGTVNGYPVLCAVTTKGDDCYDYNILVTLDPDEDRHEVARQLLDTRSLARGRSISLSGDRKLESYVEGETYYDLELIGELAEVEEGSLTPVEAVK